MMAITKRKSEGTRGTRRRQRLKMMIQPVVWRGGKDRPTGR
jgi:hypothetical protein